MRRRQFIHLKARALALRRQGKTYQDINAILGVIIPKSTLSTWLHELFLTEGELEAIRASQVHHIKRGAEKAAIVKRFRKELMMRDIKERNFYLRDVLCGPDTAKIGLAIFYLCEGGKRSGGYCSFGNSDPHIISLFLELLRGSYQLDESKFRCTVQCRADQDQKVLATFWSSITKIPLRQFYAARIDKRTIGKPTQKLDYKGVCKVDYFSAAIYNELKIIGDLL